MYARSKGMLGICISVAYIYSYIISHANIIHGNDFNRIEYFM